MSHFKSGDDHKYSTNAEDSEVTSGVTGVGVTRGGNWWVSPYFFLKKSDDLS